MAQTIGVYVLLALTNIQSVTADAIQCEDKAMYDPCGPGDEGICVCPNGNVVTNANSGETPCENTVCKKHVCYGVSGRDAIPKKGTNGHFLFCNSNEDCGQNFMCTDSNYCCPMPKGKHTGLLTDGMYGK